MAELLLDRGVGVWGTFEWLANPEALPMVEMAKLHDPSKLVVVVGCGTSNLSESVLEAGFERVLSMDIDSETIETMRLRYAEVPGLTFECADVACQTCVERGEAELVVDKGTLDCVMCNPAVSDAVDKHGLNTTIGIRPRFIKTLLI